MQKVTEAIINRSSDSQDALLMTDYTNNFIFRGNCFSLTDVLEVAGSATNYYLFGCAGCSKQVVTYPPSFNSNGSMEITIYGGTDYTATTKMNVQNRNVNSTITPESFLYSGATGSSKGIESSQYLLSAGHKSGGAVQGDLPFVLDGINYLIEIVNNESTATKVGVQFIYFEY